MEIRTKSKEKIVSCHVCGSHVFQVSLTSRRIAMQRIQRPELRSWISRDKITAQQFLTQCSDENLSETVDEANMTFSQFLKHCKIRASKTALISFPSDCDPVRNLTCDEETVLRDGGLSSAETSEWLADVDLESVKYLQRHPGSRAGTVDYAKLSSADSVPEHRPTNSQSDSATSTVAVLPPKGLEAVLVLQVFRPTNPADAKKPAVVVDMEIEVLSWQTLLDVRLSLCCASDLDTNSSLPDFRKSAYFFIGDTFFNDTRPGCIDYSQPIMDWALEPGRGIGPFVARDMSSVQLADLPFQLGYPYLYVHQGDCEHWIVFKDMKLLQNRNIRYSEYPKLKPIARRHQVRCDLCRTNVARVTVRENMRLAADPSFFCDECHRTFNLDADNRKIGAFQSQTYIDKSVLL